MCLWVEKTVGSKYSDLFQQNFKKFDRTYQISLPQIFDFCELGAMVAKFPNFSVF